MIDEAFNVNNFYTAYIISDKDLYQYSIKNDFPDKKGEYDTVISLYSKKYDEKFLQALIEFYKPLCIMEYFINKYSHMINNADDTSYIDTVIQQHLDNNTVYSRKDIVSVLVHLCCDDEDDKIINNLVDTYLEKYPTNNIDDLLNAKSIPYREPYQFRLLISYCNPYFIDLKTAEISILATDNAKKYIHDFSKDSIHIIYKLFNITNNIDCISKVNKEKLLKDYALQYDNKDSEAALLNMNPFYFLPIKSSEILEYYNNLIVRDFINIFNRVPKDCDYDLATRISEIIIEIHKQKYPSKRLKLLINNIKQNGNSGNYNADFLVYYYKNNTNKCDIPIINLFCDYLENNDVKNSIVHTLLEIFYYRYKDIVKPDHSYYIIVYSLQKLLNMDEILSLILEAVNYEISVQEWFNYIDNIDQYKELPVAWWLELVKC